MARIGLKWIKVDRMDRIGPMWIEIVPNRTKVDKIDRIRPKWTE